MYMGDGSRAKANIMGIIKLKHATRYILKLQEVSYVPSIRRTCYLFPFWMVKVIVFCLEITKLKCIRMVKWLGFFFWKLMCQFI